MKKTHSPLRYPGGKKRLAGVISQICLDNKINGHYVEPFAGGASVALHLLFENRVKKITINDMDRSIYAFWHSVLNHADEMYGYIDKTPINIKNWKKQKRIQADKENAPLLELGFSTLFLNRTNFSGVITGGPIGGTRQKGKYKLDCRFNKEDIINRIKKISKKKRRISLSDSDCLELIKEPQKESDKIFYFDPPYYLKGRYLYLNYYKPSHHEKLASTIRNMKNTPWIVSYDDTEEINRIYSWVRQKKYFNLKHFANKTKEGKEVLFFNRDLILRDGLFENARI